MSLLFTPEMVAFIRENCTKMRDDTLAEALNAEFKTEITAKQVKSYRHNHRITNGLSQNLTREEYAERHYPKGMLDFIRENSWHTPSKDMAEMVNERFGTNFTPVKMKAFRQRWGIKSGLTGWFRKENPPGNKGKKFEEYCTDPEKRANSMATRFKKGQKPINEKPLGTIQADTDGYLRIKTSMEGRDWRDRWEFYHHYIWKQAGREIPEDMVLSFKDGDKTNCALDNLFLLSKDVVFTRARWGRKGLSPEAAEVEAAVIKLKIETNKRRKEKKKK